MKNFGKWALCLSVCLLVMGFVAQSALADGGWGDEPQQRGKPADPGIQVVGPTYYGQPMMLDGKPWIDDPPKNGRPEFEASPTVGPYAWWLQPALDYHPWTDKWPKGKQPLTP